MRRERSSPRDLELGAQVATTARRLTHLYALELDWRPDRLVIDPGEARRWLDEDGPASGVLALEEDGSLFLALYLDPGDRADPATLHEEVSHLVCLAWHAAQERPVSRLALELQSEVDRWVLARLEGRDAFRHFEAFAWRPRLRPAERRRYQAAHEAGHRYCRRLARRFPRRADTPGLLRELRGFYRASPQAKLRAAAA